MSLINLVIGLIVIGVVLWIINTMIPMSPAIRKILNIVVVFVVIVYVLRFLGIFTFGTRFWVLG